MKAHRTLSILLLLTAATTSLRPASAGLVRVGGLGETQLGDAFERTYNWIWDLEVPSTALEGQHWRTKVEAYLPGSFVLPNGEVDVDGHLFGEIVHITSPAGGQKFVFDATIKRPNKAHIFGYAAQKWHTPLADDYFRYVVRDNPPMVDPAAVLTLIGRHMERGLQGRGMSVSLTNTTGRNINNLTITPDYRKYKSDENGQLVLDDQGRPVVDDEVPYIDGDDITPTKNVTNGTLAPGQRTAAVLPRVPRINGEQKPLAEEKFYRLASYKISGSGSGLTDTHLAFLGDVDDVLHEMDLGNAANFLAGQEEFFAPYLRATDEITDLFVAIDLTQWLISGADFTPGQVFDFDNGLCEDLPGVLVATTPISFVSGVGYVITAGDSESDEGGYSGQAFAAGIIDGQQVPEPSTIFLLGGGGLAFAIWRAGRGLARRIGRVASFDQPG